MLKKAVGVASLLVMLVAAVLVAPQRGRASDVDNVLVVNGPKKPVPVTGSVNVSGTANVNVTNTPNVSVTNTPNVNVTGLPAVQLAPGTTVGISGQPVAVTVTGPPGSSLPVHDVDNPARGPFQDSFSLEIDPGKSADKNENFAVNIPANTRLAITEINVLGELPVGEKLIGVNIDAFVGGSASGDFVGASFHGTSPSGVIFGGPLDIWSGDQVASLFADPGANNISLSAFRDSTAGTAHVFVQLFGHVVALP
jgi:hypothetical protein